MPGQAIFSKTIESGRGFSVTASACGDGLCGISFARGKNQDADLRPRKIPPEVLSHLDPVLSRVSSYFEGKKLPLYKWGAENSGSPGATRLVLPAASDFRLKVWEETSKIPYGKTLTYSQLAEKISGKNYRRAVARALAANVFLLLIPCHRVTGANGTGGFSGGRVGVKKRLLAMESGAGL